MLGNINCIAYYNNNSGANDILRIFKIFQLLKVYVVFMRFENISTYFVSMSFVTNALFTTWFILCCILICIYVTHRVNVNISILLRLEIWWKIYLVIIYKVCIVHHIHLWIYVCIFPNNTLKVQRNTCVCNYRDYTFNADERNGDSQRRWCPTLFLFFYTLYTMKLSWNTAYKLYFSYQTIRHALHSSIP